MGGGITTFLFLLCLALGLNRSQAQNLEVVFINGTTTYYEAVLLTSAISGSCPFDSSFVDYYHDVPDSTNTTPQVPLDEQGNNITGSITNITGITLRVYTGNNPGRRFSIPFCTGGIQLPLNFASGVLIDEPGGSNSSVISVYDIGNSRLTIFIN